jgi:hypothetical protein
MEMNSVLLQWNIGARRPQELSKKEMMPVNCQLNDIPHLLWMLKAETIKTRQVTSEARERIIFVTCAQGAQVVLSIAITPP